MCVLFCGHVFMDVHAMHVGKHAHVFTQEYKGQKLMLVSFSIAIHLFRQALSLRPELANLIRLVVHWVPGILLSLPACPLPGLELCIRWCLAFLSSFLKTRVLISKLKSSGCTASILLIVTSLLWFLPMLINLAGSLLWFLPTTIHSVCSWTSHKWNQTIYTFISDFLFTSFYH